MWTNTAFGIYMGQHDAVTTAEFEPARRHAELLGRVADARCGIASSGRTGARFGLAGAALYALTGRRLARG